MEQGTITLNTGLARMLNWLELWGSSGRAVVADAAALLGLT